MGILANKDLIFARREEEKRRKRNWSFEDDLSDRLEGLIRVAFGCKSVTNVKDSLNFPREICKISVFLRCPWFWTCYGTAWGKCRNSSTGYGKICKKRSRLSRSISRLSILGSSYDWTISSNLLDIRAAHISYKLNENTNRLLSLFPPKISVFLRSRNTSRVV